MGTRALTHIKGDVWDPEQEAPTIATIYRQMDGYPTAHGADLIRFLAGFRIVNGLGADQGKVANGMGELAALLIGALKAENPSGNIYIYPPDSEDVGEEYVYTVYNDGTRRGGVVSLRVETVSGGYEGNPRKLIVEYDGPVDEHIFAPATEPLTN